MKSIEDLMYRAKDVAKDPFKLRTLINDAKHELEFDFALRGRKHLVKERASIDMVFFGDIHGDIYTLVELMMKLNLIEHLNNGILKVVFLGDYIDRGPEQLLALASLLILKREWMDSVVLLRGNHESVKGLEPYPHDFPSVLMKMFGSHSGLELYHSFLEIFEIMPLLLYVPGKILAFHGGPPISRIERYSVVDDMLNVRDMEDFEDVLWSDPTEDIEWIAHNALRGAGKVWGWKASEKIVEKLGIKVMIRGHEPCNGFKVNHRRLVITIFSMKGYYGNEFAAALRIPYGDDSWLDNIDSHVLLV
ncbi:MAG: serine/threonine protein phosphatase [Ignisphaera sp.]|nr:serine/threonine protein phosphatase [Ignisphaera sp.]MCX8167416.1 serine/threonine protein phosphatase [Ignisphaera sp.]MDW8085928.1 metallophosphoesterase family protein [Ignisphaera sp.]